MNEKSDYDDFVQDRGVPLEGIADLLLSADDAIAAVRLARNAGIPILGGEVYVRRSGAISPAFASWDTDRKPGESLNEYARRTWNETEEYLRAYPKPEDGEPLFALVRWSSRLPSPPT
jgi:hypothetical protein